MNIGEAAKRAELPAKTIRYYEEIGLITPQRDANGYRAFQTSDVHKLTFLSRARGLGFSIEDCRALLTLWEDKARASGDVRRIAHEHLAEIDAKIANLTRMRHTLSHLVTCCAGDNRPNCPILTELSSEDDIKT